MAYVSTAGWGSYFGDPHFLDLGRSIWRKNLVPAVKRDMLLAQAMHVLNGGSGSGLGQPSPVGFADFASFQNAVIASFPACPPPFDPTCENPRDAAISAALNTWVTNPASCHNVQCDVTGAPLVVNQAYTTPTGQSASGYGIQTTSGFIPVAAPPVTAAPAPLLSPVSQPPSSLGSPVFKPSGTPLKTIPPLPAKRYTPQLVFITSRGTNSLLVGDNWTINITDAPPNSPVTVTGGMVPANVTTNMGSTDGNGRFTLSGRIDASSIGVWAESWAVGGQNVGSIGFSVSAAPSESQPPPSPPPGSGAPPFQPPSTSPSGCDPTIDPTCVPSGTAPSSGTNFFTQSVSIGGLKIPVWGFIVAAGGAILLFMGESK